MEIAVVKPIRYSIKPIGAKFNELSRHPRVVLRRAFRQAHHIPRTLKDFVKASRDRLKGTTSRPELTLTPRGARSLKGAKRQSVAEKNIDIRKLPDIRPQRERPVREQFNRDMNQSRSTTKGRSR